MLCVGDVGTNIDITVYDKDSTGTQTVVVLDGGADTILFVMIFSDGTRKSLTGTVADGANGVARYTTLDGDISVAGLLRIQLDITQPSWNGCSTVFETQVIGAL